MFSSTLSLTIIVCMICLANAASVGQSGSIKSDLPMQPIPGNAHNESEVTDAGKDTEPSQHVENATEHSTSEHMHNATGTTNKSGEAKTTVSNTSTNTSTLPHDNSSSESVSQHHSEHTSEQKVSGLSETRAKPIDLSVKDGKEATTLDSASTGTHNAPPVVEPSSATNVPPINGGHDVSGVSSGVNGAGLPSKAFGIGMTLFNVAMMIASTVVLYEKF